MPDEFHIAKMLRAIWRRPASNGSMRSNMIPRRYAERSQSDFLAAKNHYGEVLDFHALRHTTGAWLALQGIHVNVIKEVMRHSTITLTVDTYGHLMPDQHGDAISGMARMMNARGPLAATGTEPAGPDGELFGAPGVRKRSQDGASVCDRMRDEESLDGRGKDRKPLRIADVCETMRDGAPESESGASGIRTRNLAIMSRLL